MSKYTNADEAKKVLVENGIMSENEHVSIGEAVKRVNKAIIERLRSWKTEANQNRKTYAKIAECLIQLEMARNLFVSARFVNNATNAIDECIHKFQNEKGTTTSALRQALEASTPQIWGNTLIERHSAFAGDVLFLFNQRTNARGMDCILDEISASDNINKDKLSACYKKFDDLYKQLVKTNLKPNLDLRTLVSNTISLANDIRNQHKQKIEKGKKNKAKTKAKAKAKAKVEDEKTDKSKTEKKLISLKGNVRDSIVELMGHVFALWTLRNAKH